MAKNHRLTDCNKWSDKWFRDLDHQEKLFWFYLHDRCDQGGVWIEDFEEVKFHTGVDYDPGTLLKAFEKKIVYFTETKKWWIKDYCILQQSTFLWEDEKGAPRRAYVNLMIEHNVYELYKEHYISTFPGIDINKQRELSQAKRKAKANPKNKVKDKINTNGKNTTKK